MNIFAKPGAKIIFTPSTRGGLTGERGRAISALEEGKTYTVREMKRRADKADVYLEEVPGAFASILFSEVDK